MKFARPRFDDGERVVLRGDKAFVAFASTGRSQKTLPKGTTVKMARSQALFDDHGRFGRYWYHLKHEFFWEAIAEECEITKAGVLDRLALLGKEPEQPEADAPPAPWSYRTYKEDK